MLKIPYGVSNFERIRTQGYLYVDKTHFIEEVEKKNYLILLRPRRFGKSLFLSTMDSYYDVAKADKFDELFGGLYIHEFPSGKGYADLFIQKATPSKAKYEVFIEFKYLSKGATNDESVKEKLQEGITQIEGYLQDKRLANRPDLRKYVIVFSGHEAKVIHEMC